jgi:hypothetical protein
MGYILALVLLVISGCGPKKQKSVPSTSMYSVVEVQAVDTQNVICRATFYKDKKGGSITELDEDDKILCAQKQMTKETNSAGEVSYVAYQAYDPSRSYHVEIFRSSADNFSTDVQLPDPISLVSPLSNTTLTKGAAFDVQWAPSTSGADLMQTSLTFRGSTPAKQKVRQQNDRKPESGRVTFSGVDAKPGEDQGGTARGTLELKRVREARSFPGLKSEVMGTQSLAVPLYFQ